MSDTRAPAPVVVHAAEGQLLEAFGDVLQVKLHGAETEGAFALGLSTTPPGGGPPPHLHRREDELFLVLEGQLSFLIEGGWQEVGPGCVVYVPRGSVHTFRNEGSRPSRHWVLTTPAGFERFFEQCAALFAEGGPPDMQRIVKICDEHGIEFTQPADTPPRDRSGVRR